MAERLFGTDGVRGLAGEELTAELARGLGRAAVSVLGSHGEAKPVVVVGRDPRESGVWLEAALVAGIRSAGGDVLLAGVQPTPAIAFLTVDLGASCGAVISASHNPQEYNGIKFFGRTGYKLSDDLEDEIEALLVDAWSADYSDPGASGTAGHDPGTVRVLDDAASRYLEHIASTVHTPLAGMKVVVDCANGAAFSDSPELLRRLGAEVHAINDAPDGTNINEHCGALHPGRRCGRGGSAGRRRRCRARRRRRPRAVRRRTRLGYRRRSGACCVRHRHARDGECSPATSWSPP